MLDPGQPIKVLVVDDEGLINHLIQSRLENLGYQVAGSAMNAAEAVKKTLELHPDLVIMDLQMVDAETGEDDMLAGIRATREIQRVCPTPIILLTAYESTDFIHQASEAGVGAYLVKPVQDSELQRSIAVALARFNDLMTMRRLNEELSRVNTELQNEINERKQAELVLRRQVMTLEHMFDAAIITNSEGIIIDWNPAAERLFGYTKEEALGKSPDLVHRQEDIPELQNHILQEINVNNYWSGVVAFVRKDGREGFLEISVVPLRDADGKILLTIGVNRDITERMKAEMELTHERYLMRKLMENMPDSIYFKDLESRFIAVSNAGVRRCGFRDPSEMIGKTDFDLFVPENAQLFYEEEQKIINTGESIIGHTEEEIWYDGRRRWVLTTKMPLKNEKDEIIGTFGISTDITESVLTNAELEKKTAELARSNRELEHFAYIASHDLQEPLRKIRGFIELLQSRYKESLDERGQEYIDRTVDAATRMQSMVTNLLEYSRIGTKEMIKTRTDFESVLQVVLSDLEVAMQDADAIVTHDPLPTLMVNAPFMLHLFQNLISNAIKFRREKPVKIHVSALKQKTRSLNKGTTGSDFEWLFAVQDNGIGIKAENYEKIFGLFERLHGRSEYPGAGIGLAMCKKIVERHGGRIWLESRPGQGTVFYFTLPDVEGSDG